MAVLGYVALANSTPFGVTRSFHAGSKQLSAIGPKSRVQTTGGISKQVSDYSYFTSAMPFAFDHANVKLKIHNLTPDQMVSLGYKDQSSWHYAQTEVSTPLLEELNWPHVGESPALFQRTKKFNDVTSFMSSPPTNGLIGVYNYDATGLSQQQVTLPNYKPALKDTVINTPLRGKITMYMYLSGEAFKLSITKRDLNWYPDPDTAEISVYKGGSKVYEATIDDDGNTGGDGKHGPAQTIAIKNPGPGLPEAGVYKVVIDQPRDAVVTKIESNLHKIAFEGPVYPVNNHDVYGSVAQDTAPTSLYTNAHALTAETDHVALQTVSAGNVMVPLSKDLTAVPFDTGSPTATITMPKSDVIINGVGYFSFTPDQFFAPTPYHIMPITSAADISRVDYVLTNYRPPKELGGGWVEVEHDFDLSDAVAEKGKLSWIIAAPGLKASDRSIEIKDIQMTLTKKGWFQ